jgi:hypothetical protein
MHFADEGVRIGILRNVVLTVWLASPTAHRVRAFRAAQRVVAAGPGEFGGISIMAPAANAKVDLGEELRREFVASMTEFNGRPVSAAVVVEGAGFMAASLRALTSGITLVARPKYPIKVFANRTDAARWLAPLVVRGATPPLTESELLAGLADVARDEAKHVV